MTNPLYVFDMDETLVNGDCAMLWHEFLVEKGIVRNLNFIEEDQRLMRLYAKGELDMQTYLDFSVEPISHLSIKEIVELADLCVEEKILPRVFPEALTLLEQLRQQQHSVLIISATVAFLVEAVAKRLGVKHALGINLVTNKNRLSSTILGTASYQQGKVTRLQQWCESHSTGFTAVHFYTDSINDLPLCEHVDFAYLVNPCEKLAKKGEEYNWQIFSWG